MTQFTRPLPTTDNRDDDRKTHMVRNPMQPAGSSLFGGWGPRLR
jgi:hypothetical protein